MAFSRRADSCSNTSVISPDDLVSWIFILGEGSGEVNRRGLGPAGRGAAGRRERSVSSVRTGRFRGPRLDKSGRTAYRGTGLGLFNRLWIDLVFHL